MTHINAIATPTNDTYYSCHYNYAVEAFTNHFTPLVINSLGDRHNKHTYTHEHIMNKTSFQKPGVSQPQTGIWLHGLTINSMSFRTLIAILKILCYKAYSNSHTNLNTGS